MVISHRICCMREVLLVLGRGVGQVMFQNNAFSGLLMWIGLLCNSWVLALLALAGNAVSTFVAWLSGYSKEDIRNGLYGFNGTLVGIAMGVFFQLNPWTIGMLVLGAALSTWIARAWMLQHRLPGFTAPFIVVVWLLLLGYVCFQSDWLLPSVQPVEQPTVQWFQAFSLNVGQVMFQGNVFSGLLFLAGILVNAPLQAGYAVLGASLPLSMVFFMGGDYLSFNTGLFGYNGVLCALALGDRSISGCWWAIFAVVLSVVLQVVGMSCGITTLTAPFVLAVWIVLCVKQCCKQR